MGYHLNRGREREGEFVSASQLREHFYQPGLIGRRLGAAARTPVVELLSSPEVEGEEEVTISVRVIDQGGGIGGLVYFVDGQPHAGRQAGIVADATDSRSFPLPPGSRRIEVAALNRALCLAKNSS